MNLNDLGSWCVVWFDGSAKLAHAFFDSRDTALRYRDETGGELYLKHADGSLHRNG